MVDRVSTPFLYIFVVSIFIVKSFLHSSYKFNVAADRFALEERRRRTQSAGDLGERKLYGRTDDSRAVSKANSDEKTEGKTENRESHAKTGDQKEGEGKSCNDTKLNQNKKYSINGKPGGNSKAQTSSPVRQMGKQQQHQRGQHGHQSYGQQYHGQQSHGQQQRSHMRQNRRVVRHEGKSILETKQNGTKSNNQKSKQGKLSEHQSGICSTFFQLDCSHLG